MVLAAFGDLPEIVSIQAACAGVAGLLAVAVAAILAVKIGISLLMLLMSAFGVSRSRVD